MEDKKYLKEIGRKIAQIRKERGLTQAEFAEKHGFDRGSFARIESGNVNSTVIMLRKIARCLDVEIGELLKTD